MKRVPESLEYTGVWGRTNVKLKTRPMKKVSIFVIKLLSGFLATVWLSTQSQGQTIPNRIDMDKDSEQLSKEISYMTDRATKLRTHSRLAEGETREVMLRDAEILEKECLVKQLKYNHLHYNNHLKLVDENHSTITSLQKAVAGNENQMHIKFLLEASEKNAQSAEEIFQEATSQPNQVLKLASLENAVEKVSLARNQQDEAIVLLKRGNGKIAKDR